MRRASASNECEYVLIAQPRRAFRPTPKEGSAQTIANVMEMVATFSLTSTIYRAGRSIIRKVLKTKIWVVPPVCLGSR